MRFRPLRSQFATRWCWVSAIALSTLLGGSAKAFQVGNGYGTTPFDGYGSVAATPVQSFATASPTQAYATGYDHQSMSPDSWGSSAPISADPMFAPSPNAASGSPANARSKYSLPQNAQGRQYETTGAPSMQSLLGKQGEPTVPQSNLGAPQSSFRPARYDLQDRGDIPLAPIVPSSILDENDNRLDSTAPKAADAILPPDLNEAAPSDGIQLESSEGFQPPTEFKNEPTVVPGSQPFGQPQPQVYEAPVSPVQPYSSSVAGNSNSFQPETQSPYPQTLAQPFAPLTGQPASQYQMPEVFESAPSNVSVMPPIAIAPAFDSAGGFGWGNAPAMFQQSSQPSMGSQQPFVPQGQIQTGPAFPMPFGLNSKGIRKLFGKRSRAQQSQAELALASQGETRHGKPIDPNTYPPQPMSHSQPAISPMNMPNAQFRPDLGQRSPLPTVRNPGTYDSGKTEYDFENKKREFPPFSEILATGRWFGSIEGQFIKPRFNGNSGIVVLDQSSGSNVNDAQVFDFDFEFIPNLRFGFESKYGPGFEVDYRKLRTASVVQSFTSGAASSGSLRAALPDMTIGSQIFTSAGGQTIAGAHTFNFESYGFSVFKEVQLPVTRIGGTFGFQAVDIDHQVDATVVDGAGTVLQSLNTTSDMRAFGPRIRIEYYRPVGHTPLEFLTHAGGSLMFGKRDQFIRNAGGDSFQRIGTDEIVSSIEFLTALQIKKRIGENRSVYGRIGYLNQTFNSGGSGFLAQDDFGLRGITFMVGVNR